ncbi:glycosyltransferase [Roseovarius mucosus]|uniref:glycosyltransferase family 2 protein n=1 Tax=Roseovarius mucosus TaxID=215743 RepID=UPI001C5FBBCE|nr:glycosyltransferase family 2 protein [Roseovarius mucosus]MBW4975753.1 glycosyltransferase [Roseovarius mucosus]
MGISELRHMRAQGSGARVPINPLGRELVRAGKISRSDATLAELVRRHCDTSLDRILQAEGLATEDDLLAAHARRLSSTRLSAEDVMRAELVESGLDPRFLLKHGVLPIQSAAGVPVLATGGPDSLASLRPALPRKLDRARVVMAPRHAIQDRIAHEHRDILRSMAEARVPEIESCRTWSAHQNRRLHLTLAALAVLVALSLAFPITVFSIFAVWACFTLIVSAGLKIAAFVAQTSGRSDAPPAPSSPQPLPKVSILVPLFRETEIAHALIARLSRLTYPKCLLDVILVLEEEDALTRQTLAGIDLPPWVRPVIVPDGKPRTKPRAMNYALDFCQGDIIGIFDAEDAPEADQITIIARRFQQVPREVACLQGILDYYNPGQNWLARCFTIEYAAWFRTLMPGMARLGLAIPLGGTTLYFRRDVLEELGGWDAHNVTEDADLGFRLARHGYRTEMIHTVTEEEANCRAWPWIKQRSRWLKGYMTTYLVHMRQPRLLYAQLGPRKFWGFQAHFVSALSQFLLAPVLLSFWLVLFGLPHPLDTVVPHALLVALGSLFLLVEVLNVSIHMASVSGPRHRHLMAWAPTMHFYTPLGTIAAYKALYELILKPFFWDKTTHGLSVTARGQPNSDGGFDLSGIKLEPGHKGL